MVDQQTRERLEVDYWSNAPTATPAYLDAFTNKMSEARVVLEKFATFHDVFESANDVLEVGAGQGWASCLLSRHFAPKRSIVVSDISQEALESLPEWESILRAKVTRSIACRSYDIPVESGSFDLVFAFASAHHFGAQRRTLKELGRVLRPGGTILYLHEPACRDLFYTMAVDRVNRRRPAVREDVLRYRHLEVIARELGFGVQTVLAPTTTYRRPKETMYYLALQKSRLLRSWLPCSVDVVLTKPGAGVVEPRRGDGQRPQSQP